MADKNKQDLKKLLASSKTEQSKTKQIKVSEPEAHDKAYQIPKKRKEYHEDITLKPVSLINPQMNRIIGFLVFLSTLIVYMMTQARTMSFWDSGEYATCASILGVPHPPGNPFYIVFSRALIALLGHWFSHALIVAFISGLASALAVMFTYLITVKLVSMFHTHKYEAIFAGIFSALFTAYSFTFWMNAIEAEVYSGLVFFINFIIWLMLVWVEKSDDFSHQHILLLILYSFFLGFCVHQLTLQIAPAILFIFAYPLIKSNIHNTNFWIKVIGYFFLLIISYALFNVVGKNIHFPSFGKWIFAIVAFGIIYYELRDVVDRRVWLLGLSLIIIGFSAHLFLMIRAAERPYINEGHPSTLQMFSDYVLRKQYGSTSMFERRGNLITDQFGYHFFRYFGMQWFSAETISTIVKIPAILIKIIGNLIISLLGIFGAFYLAQKNKHSFAYLMSIFIFTTFVMVFVMNLSNAEVRDRDYFFVCAYNMWAIWMGIGALGLIQLLKTKVAKIILLVLLSTLPIINFASQYKLHDRSQEFIALDYGVNFLNSLEKNAIIFTNGDNDTFPLWYAQAVHDPYAKEHVYPAKEVVYDKEAAEAIDKAMKFKNAALKGIRKDVSVANLSLLNTPWYIKQLRDREGILFNKSDAEIDKMDLTQRGFTLDIPNPDGSLAFSIDYPDEPKLRANEPFYRVADQAVMQIIKDNFGKRPIYFAVTCENYVNFEDYTRNEGMVARVVSTKDRDQLDINRLMTNINKIYQYRSIDNKRVYKDDNMARLITNYGSGYVRAAIYYVKAKQYDLSQTLIKKAHRFIKDDFKFSDYYFKYYVYRDDWQGLDKFLATKIYPNPDGWKAYALFLYETMSDFPIDKTYKYIDIGFQKYPDNEYISQFALEYTIKKDREDDIADWLVKYKSNIMMDMLSSDFDVSYMIIKNGITKYPNEEFFVQFAVQCAKKNNEQQRMIQLLQLIKPMVKYDITPYIDELNEKS